MRPPVPGAAHGGPAKEALPACATPGSPLLLFSLPQFPQLDTKKVVSRNL